MSKSLKAAKNRTTGNRSKRNFIGGSILAYDFLKNCSVLYSAASRHRGETRHGRTPRRAEIPLRRRACARRLLVVPLRGIEEPAVLRRHAQDDRIHPCEIHRHQGRKTVAVRLQAHPQSAVLRRDPQDAVAAECGLHSAISSPRTSDLPARCPRGTSPLWLRPSPAR